MRSDLFQLSKENLIYYTLNDSYHKYLKLIFITSEQGISTNNIFGWTSSDRGSSYTHIARSRRVVAHFCHIYCQSTTIIYGLVVSFAMTRDFRAQFCGDGHTHACTRTNKHADRYTRTNACQKLLIMLRTRKAASIYRELEKERQTHLRGKYTTLRRRCTVVGQKGVGTRHLSALLPIYRYARLSLRMSCGMQSRTRAHTHS